MAWLKRRGEKLYIAFMEPGRKHPRLLTTGLDVSQRAEAEELLREWERGRREAGKAVHAPTTLTLQAWGEKWIAGRKARGVLDWVHEESHLRHHVYPLIGARPLGEITKGELLDWVRSLAARMSRETGRPLAPKYVKRIQATMKMLFKEAVKRDLVPVTPCVWDATDLPRGEDLDAARALEGGFSAEQVGWIIGDPRIPADRRMLYALELLTGMRTGEAAIRRWKDWTPDFHGGLGRLVVATAWCGRSRSLMETRTASLLSIAA